MQEQDNSTSALELREKYSLLVANALETLYKLVVPFLFITSRRAIKMPEKETEIKKDNLETIKLMLAYLCVKGEETLANKVAILDIFDLTDHQRAQICGAKYNSIRQARQKLKN